MRRIPTDKEGTPISPPAVEPVLDSRVSGGRRIPLITQTRSYELITPLFGGGAKPGRADSDLVIRGSGIRGQLRFWWRACRGGKFGGDLRRMREAESRLWGAASTPSKPRVSQVELAVKVTRRGGPLTAFSLQSREGRAPVARSVAAVAHPYVAFPLQPEREAIRRDGTETTIHSLMGNVRFDLILTFPESERAEVEAALWAWETFGGVGGRTRRGFGALRLTSVDPKPSSETDQVATPQDIRLLIEEGLHRHVSDGEWPDGIPRFAKDPRMAVTQVFDSATQAWNHLAKRLCEFRQERYPRNPPLTPGRSKWPEPDEIRRLTGSSCYRHRDPISEVRKFPRAAFGLPIVFHFKDEAAGDPSTTTLQGGAEGCERLASPLILRPVACDGGGAVGLALVLEGTSVEQIPEGLVLKGDQREYSVQAMLTNQEAATIQPLHGDPNVLQVFLNSL
ncbi:MAG: type III-B CRISPR module RAMP protein Cmr1 [Clostridia bacterium]|nr:type III-B CRISPR module RAMP protein Cmr1 [Clostridia bacterium]